MDNVTFRTVDLQQSEAEKIDENPKQKPIASPPPDKMSEPEKDKLVPPFTLYKDLKGRPFTVDFLGVKDFWNLIQAEEKTSRTFNRLDTKIQVIEGYVRRQIKRNFMTDNTDSYKRVMKMVNKVINYSGESDALERVNKVYAFVISKNKDRAFRNLRKALMTGAIDQLVDLDTVRPSIVGKFMPRRD